MFQVDTLKNNLKSGGARANLFNTQWNWPANVEVDGAGRQCEILCKAAQLPSSVVGQIDVPFRGRQLKVAGDRTFENWTVTFINENNFAIRNSFEKWMSLLNQHKEGIGNHTLEQYYATLTVQQLQRTKENDVVKKINIVDAFPVNVSAIDLSYDTTDTIEEFTVEFAYQYWTSESSTDS
jgi:hypothetical protein